MAAVIRINFSASLRSWQKASRRWLEMAASVLPEFSAIKRCEITKDKSPLCNQTMPSSHEPTHIDNFLSKDGLHSLETSGQDVFVRIGLGTIIAHAALQEKLRGLVGRRRGVLILDGAHYMADSMGVCKA
jgi:hypothetical protein